MPNRHGSQCALFGKECQTTGRSLLYRGRLHASNHAKATAFVQEYVENSGRKCDKDSVKAVMDLRCLTRSTRNNPRQQMEEAFAAGELREVLSQLKVGKAAVSDGLAPDFLKHLDKGLTSSIDYL